MVAVQVIRISFLFLFNSKFQNRRLIPCLVEQFKSSMDESLRIKSNQCLLLLGFVRPPKGRGINLLTIDGGGTRGMMGLEVLQELENNLNGKKVNFDFLNSENEMILDLRNFRYDCWCEHGSDHCGFSRRKRPKYSGGKENLCGHFAETFRSGKTFGS